MKRNELLRDRAAPILAEFNEAVLVLLERDVDANLATALGAAFDHLRTAYEPTVVDSPPPVTVRKKAKRSSAKPNKSRRTAVQPEAVVAERDLKPAKNAPKGATCSKCGTPGHNARTCRGGRGGGVELGEVDRPTTDHDRRELIAAHQQRLAAERAAKEKQKRDAWLDQSGAAA